MIESSESAHASKSKSQQPAVSASSSKENIESIDKIREILVGSKILEQNLRLENLQAKVDSQFGSLRGEYLDRISTLEKYLKQELKVSDERLTREALDKEKNLKKVAQSIEDLRKNVDAQFEVYNKSYTQELRDVRNLILSTTKSLSEELHSLHQKFVVEINHDIEQLSASKINRTHLAEIMSDWSSRLSQPPVAKHG